jgi:tetratricopeptide (TPR) repeat protein
LQWLDAALAVLGPGDVRETAHVYIGRARFLWRLHAYDEAYEAATHARAVARDLDDDLLYATALLLIGDPAAFLGRYDEAVAVVGEAAAIFERLGDWRGERAALFDLARIAFRNADYAEARDRLASLLLFFRDRGEESAAMHVAIDLGEAEFHLGHRDAALANAYDALAEARRLRSLLTESVILLNLAAYHLDIGATAEATRFACESLAISQANRYDVYGAFALGYIAQTLTQAGRHYDAAVLCGYADRELAEASVQRQATEERCYERTIASIATALGPGELQRARDDGAALDRSEAAALALDVDGVYQPQS